MFKNPLRLGQYMSDDEAVVEEETEEVAEEVVEEVPVDPLEEALARAEAAEKEISYRDAEIQNVRKRLMSEKAAAMKFGGQGMARRMLGVLTDIDRALATSEDEVLTLIRQKMWSELSGDGVTQIETKGKRFDPATMEAITAIPPSEDFPANMVVDELEAGYLYKDRVVTPARVVVASEQ
jgi:molecular chaperone GrpE (heat shock protein)